MQEKEAPPTGATASSSSAALNTGASSEKGAAQEEGQTKVDLKKHAFLSARLDRARAKGKFGSLSTDNWIRHGITSGQSGEEQDSSSSGLLSDEEEESVAVAPQEGPRKKRSVRPVMKPPPSPLPTRLKLRADVEELLLREELKDQRRAEREQEEERRAESHAIWRSKWVSATAIAKARFAIARQKIEEMNPVEGVDSPSAEILTLLEKVVKQNDAIMNQQEEQAALLRILAARPV